MLGDLTIVPTVAVKDLEKAKSFYEGTLGLSPVGDEAGGIKYKAGDSYLFIYESPDVAGTNKATYAGWQSGDLKATVADLKEKGLTFEKYDFPGVEYDGDIHVMGDYSAVWFKDPDGNIFAIDDTKSQ